MAYSIDDMRDAEWDYEDEPVELDEDDAEEVAKWRAAIDRTVAERQARPEKPWCPATITFEGEVSRHRGEPRATIIDVGYAELTGRSAERKDMPLGRNIGEIIPVGTTGFARYESDCRCGLWRFVTELPRGEGKS